MNVILSTDLSTQHIGYMSYPWKKKKFKYHLLYSFPFFSLLTVFHYAKALVEGVGPLTHVGFAHK